MNKVMLFQATKRSTFQQEKKKKKDSMSSKKLKDTKRSKQKLRQTYNFLSEKDEHKVDENAKDVERRPSEESLIFLGTSYCTPIIDLTQDDTVELLRPTKKQMYLNINDFKCNGEMNDMDVDTANSKTSLSKEQKEQEPDNSMVSLTGENIVNERSSSSERSIVESPNHIQEITDTNQEHEMLDLVETINDNLMV